MDGPTSNVGVADGVVGFVGAAVPGGIPAHAPPTHQLPHTTSDSQTATAAAHTASYSPAQYLARRIHH